MKTPNPGSEEAARKGCFCPVLDNGHGRVSPFPPDGWWITAGCPVHDGPESKWPPTGVKPPKGKVEN